MTTVNIEHTLTTKEKITRCKVEIENAKALRKYYQTEQKNARLADEWGYVIKKLIKERDALKAEAQREAVQ